MGVSKKKSRDNGMITGAGERGKEGGKGGETTWGKWVIRSRLGKWGHLLIDFCVIEKFYFKFKFFLKKKF